MAYEQKEKEACLECGGELYRSRKGQKFCCESCKNRFHNRRVSSSRNFRLKTIHALEKNYMVLDSVLRDGEESIDLMLARTLGYDEKLMTSCIRMRGFMLCSCFDITFIQGPTKLRSITRAEKR
ncbi:MAG: hypothetical protein HUJ94_08675 [Bacteroidales bacterium]|nr:hypothetical protein [Bacteroidales bacterium]